MRPRATPPPSTAAPNATNFERGVLSDSSSLLLLVRQLGAREHAARGLHGGFARSSVLFVLSALTRVPAFDLGRVGSRERDVDDPVDATGTVRGRAKGDDAH